MTAIIRKVNVICRVSHVSMDVLVALINPLSYFVVAAINLFFYECPSYKFPITNFEIKSYNRIKAQFKIKSSIKFYLKIISSAFGFRFFFRFHEVENE